MAKHLAKCPKCGGRVDFDSAVGDHVVCASCQAKLKVPASAKSHYPTGSPTLNDEPPQPAEGQARTSRPPQVDPLIGTTLGEFEIVELLGRGGMGAVYKARQASLGRLVAIKVLPQSLASDESFIERFDREARSAAAVRHPNIIEIFAVGEDRGYQYIAMEFIDGDTLADILKREGRLQPARAVEIMRAVASALAEAHECGILHRDIKPSNILIDAKGRVKVADFGLAKHEGVDVSVTVTGQALGTPLYMPPEAARGEGFDARSDLYSLGATFYHALAGKPPFEADTPALLIVKHLEGRVPPLQDAAPDCPTALCRAIHRLLRKNPAERYESADKLLEVLARIETGLRAEESTPTQTVPTTPGTAPQRPATARRRPPTRRKPTARQEDVGGASLPRVLPRWLLVAAGVLLLVLVLVLVLVLSRPSTRPSAVAPPPSPEPGTRNLEPGLAPAVAERNAEIVLRNVQVCITRKDYTKAQTWLAKLRSDYGATKFAAAHRADIAALQQQIDAYVKGTARPQPPKPGTQHPAPPPPQPPKPEPPPDDDERWTEWVDLFDGKTLKGWAVVPKFLLPKDNRVPFTGDGTGGKVHVEDGRAVLERGMPRTGIRWQGALPGSGYEVEVQAMRVTGKGSFANIAFLAGGPQHLSVGSGDGGLIALSVVDGKDGSDNLTTRKVTLDSGRWYRVRLRVTPRVIAAWLDDTSLFKVVRAEHDLPGGPVFAPLMPLCINTWETGAAIRSIRLRRLKPEPPPHDERWTKWEDLFDGKTLKGWRVPLGFPDGKAGEVRVQDAQIVLECGHPRTGIACTQPVPSEDYEIALDAVPLNGGNAFAAVVFRVGDQCSYLNVTAKGVELAYLGDRGARETRDEQVDFEDGRSYSLRLRVTSTRVEVWVDDQKRLELGRAGRRFYMSPHLDALSPLGVYAYETKSALRSIRLRRLKPVPWTVYTQWPFDAAEAKRRQTETAKALGVPVEQDIDLGNNVKLTLVLIPAGEFLMGSPPTRSPEQLQEVFGDKVEFYQREFPQHGVKISRPIWLGKTEVTQAQWQAVIGDNPSKSQGMLRNPVEQVSWNDCQAFLQTLSAKFKQTFRLPTEAEWEYACRAGIPTGFYFGDSQTVLPQHAWFDANSGGSTHPVGQKKPNAWGLHDMYGNVWEWCEDWYAAYDKAPQIDPRAPGPGRVRVLRGGSCRAAPRRCRSVHRYMWSPTHRHWDTGLRVCVLAVPSEAREQQPPPEGKRQAPGPAADQIDARLRAAMEPVAAKVQAWDFAGAAAELAKLKVEDKALAERVARRREEVGRMAALKAKMIERVNTAKPPLRKSTLGIKGINADLAKADEQGITTAKLQTGKAETFAWKDLKPDAVRRLVGYTAKSADDHLAAGILLLECSRHAPRDGIPHAAREDYTAAVQAAEEHFAKAKAGGAAIDRYLDPLAAASFARAKALLEETRGVGTPRPQAKLAAAQAALAAIEKEYGKTAWFAAHQDEVAAARETAKAGIAEAEAEELYRQAAKLAKEKDLWALKPVIDKLKADYPNAKLLTDAARKPTFAEMAAAVAKLGKFLTVRKDGKGDFTSIQAAIDAAPPNSLIEIQDRGPYPERLAISKRGICVRGKGPAWPLITSQGSPKQLGELVLVQASGAALDRLILSHGAARRKADVVAVRQGAACRMRRVVAYLPKLDSNCGFKIAKGGGPTEFEGCFLVGNGAVHGPVSFRHTVWVSNWSVNGVGEATFENCVIAGEGLYDAHDCQFRMCTFWGPIGIRKAPSVLIDCIAGKLQVDQLRTRLEHCDVIVMSGVGKLGQRCFSADPQFRDPDNLDFRLKPTSPCRKRASDGGDIGCRYTQEMLEMLKLAHELRRKGIIKF